MKLRTIEPNLYRPVYPFGVDSRLLPWIYYGALACGVFGYFCVPDIWVVPGWFLCGFSYGLGGYLFSLWACYGRRPGWLEFRIRALFTGKERHGVRPSDSIGISFLAGGDE